MMTRKPSSGDRLAGKTVIVTGAGGGIGATIASLCAAQGANVVLADIGFAGVDSNVEFIRESGGNAVSCVFDLDDERTVAGLFEFASNEFGDLHALVNNAANTSLIARDPGVENMDVDLWDETMRVNLRGTMLACKYAIPRLRSAGGGAIVNIASLSALRGAPAWTAYGVGKAGVITLSQYVAAQHGREGIRCNAIAPGVILTPATENGLGAHQDVVVQHSLAPRIGRPEDIAGTVLWLISDEGAYVNGQCISVDGGMTSHLNVLFENIARSASGG
ncbi:NAD(P)-dependent dehydrogenase (short-subunit alcohol dehydrogenase family) [Sphingobium xenophagum]|uniref:NAD(P)-dependent dehydrogenase (Short-subunit alcohol dehydrogenase family) n=1 Tax=Sphingobium xenophagum TaxID=121428 RepID=A0ABU1X5S2_SPHXE|nr:SDR family oxidoreductase [Sphingobium xenophagum]MDR7156824.1 NAD(P)-dependent dehydrogenase (short-subunit alcohol dehydrogenase family) [Sphingobium xenophagum]